MSDKDKPKPGSFQYVDDVRRGTPLVGAEKELRFTATTFLYENHCTCRRQNHCLWCVCYELVDDLDKYHKWVKGQRPTFYPPSSQEKTT